jgi:predicted nucleic acid-binding Zn ribbon protein
MSQSNEQSIGDVIREFLHAYDLEDQMNETRLIHSWEKVAGKLVARHTQNLHIRNKVLFVKIDSPALKNELNYSRGKILEMLNKAVKSKVIEDIVFQ